MSKKLIYSIAAALFFIFYVSSSFNHVFTEYFWFKSVKFDSVYWTIFNAKIAISSTVFLLYFAVIFLNLKIALVATKNRAFQVRFNKNTSIDFNKLINLGVILVSAFFAFISTGAASGMWDDLLKFQKATAFGIKDPVFQHDIGFYFFKLPVIVYVKNMLISLVFLSLVSSGVVYFFKGAIQLVGGWYKNFAKDVKIHLGVLISILLVLFGVHFWLLRFNLLYSTTGVSTGAGYTDTHARLFGYNLMALLFLLSVPVVVYSMFSNKVRPLFWAP